MSGYFVVAQLDGKPVDEQLLERIAGRLVLRGLDGTSIWKKENVGGCFTLMHTNSAPQSLRQPVVLGDRYFLWGDLRLDGQTELRSQLGDRTLATNSGETSEELLLRAWHIWAERALERVIGDFSFALWDARESSLVCARDFIGARPLYYAHVGNALYVGNTLEVFREVPDISRQLDEQFIADFLVEGTSLDAACTVYRAIRRLPPGYGLKFSNTGSEVRRFRKLPVEEPLELADQQAYVEVYLDLLREAVRDRLPAGATALYLSGGLDSGAVSATAAEIMDGRNHREKLKAFTLGWEPFFRDPEPQFAAISARHLGIAHEVLTEAELIPFAGADSSEWTIPEPDQEYFFTREKKQFQKIAAYSNVVLGGDGGDDVLTGQGWPYLLQLWRRRDWKRMAQDFGGYFWTHQRFPPLRAGVRGKISEFLRPQDKFDGYPSWLAADFEAKLAIRQRWCERENQGTRREHPLHPEAYQALHEAYWAGVFETEDAGWSGIRLETRAPLLDLRLLHFLLRLPPVPWCVNKQLCRRAMKMKLPDAVLLRPKTPLMNEPLEYCTMPDGWAENLPAGDRKRIERFVNWDKWCETLSASKGLPSWRNLRPISLLLWLKAVEIRMGIK